MYARRGQTGCSRPARATGSDGTRSRTSSWRTRACRGTTPCCGCERDFWLLEDSGSTNGTFVGADRVQQVPITGRLPDPAGPSRRTARPSPARSAGAPAGRGNTAVADPPVPPPRPHRPAAAAAVAAAASAAPRCPRPAAAPRRHRRSSRAAPPASPARRGRRRPARQRRSRRGPSRRSPRRRWPQAPGRTVSRELAGPPAAAQRRHERADHGAADRPGRRQRRRGGRPERVPVPRRAAPEPRAAATRSSTSTATTAPSSTASGSPPPPVTEIDLIGVGPATFQLVGDELQEFIDTGDISLTRPRPDGHAAQRAGAARPRELPARRALPARRHRPERRRQVHPARRAHRDGPGQRRRRPVRQPRSLHPLRRAAAPDRAGPAGEHPAHPAHRRARARLRGRAALPVATPARPSASAGSPRCWRNWR